MPAFTCARAVGNLWGICLGVRTLNLEWSGFKMPVPLDFVENILLSKAPRIFSLHSKNYTSYQEPFLFLVFFSWLLGSVFFLKFMILANRPVWYLSASSILILPS